MHVKVELCPCVVRRGWITVALLLCGPWAWAQGGLGFTAPEALNSTAATDTGSDGPPDIAMGGTGVWTALWSSSENVGGTIGTDRDILMSRSTDFGATWPTPMAFNEDAALDTKDDTDPQVATDGAGHWVAVWRSEGGPLGTDGDVFMARATNDALSWGPSSALTLNATSDVLAEYRPQVAMDGSGHCVVTWYGTTASGGDNEIKFCRSSDYGATWSAPSTLNTNAGTDSGNDIEPRIGTDGFGRWIAVWLSNDSLGGTIGNDYDVLYARSTNYGATWSAPVALNPWAATDGALDDADATVMRSPTGEWIAAWQGTDPADAAVGNDLEIYYRISENNGATWLPAAPLNTDATTDAGPDRRISLAVDGDSHWVAVWARNLGAEWDILAARSADGGDTWTAPVLLSPNGGTETHLDDSPHVTTDRQGHWVATWNGVDALLPTIGSDGDILVATMDRATDSDGDGADDLSETDSGAFVDSWNIGTDPADPDTDNDALQDGDEVLHHTDPFSPDTDADSLPDGWEVAHWLDPTDDGSWEAQNGPAGDPDGDGYNNLLEYQGGSDPQDPLSVPNLPLPAGGVVGLGVGAAAVCGLAALLLRRRRTLC